VFKQYTWYLVDLEKMFMRGVAISVQDPQIIFFISDLYCNWFFLFAINFIFLKIIKT